MQEQWLGIKSCALFFRYAFNRQEKGFMTAGFFCPLLEMSSTHGMDIHTLAHSKADTQTTIYNTVQSKNIILKHLFFFPHGSLKVAILNDLFTPAFLHEAKCWAQTCPGTLSTFLYLFSPPPDQQRLGEHGDGDTWRWWKTHQSVGLSGVRGWEWGRRKGHRGLLSRPGCICSHGHWVGGTGEGEARTLKVKRPKKRWASGFSIPSKSIMGFFFLHFFTECVLNQLTFWRHQVLQQVSADDLCWKAVEKRGDCYFIYNRTH